jgi:uncharacterized membrane protein
MHIKGVSLFQQMLLLFIWLIFFPNALYLITDLIHLGQATTIPKWFDAVIIFSAAILGLIMAFISLLRVELYLTKQYTKSTVQWMVLMILFVGSFGVYLGRF